MRRLLARTAPVGAVVVANLASGTALTRTTLSVFDELDRVRGKQRMD